MKRIYLLAFLFIAGCSQIPIQKSQVTISSTPTFITETNTLLPTATITPLPISSAYCDPVEANAAIKKLIDIGGIPIEDNLPTSTPGPNDNQPLTDIQQAGAIAELKEKQFEISLLNVPECLQSAKKYLINSYDGFIQLFSLDENDSNDDAWSALVNISNEEGLYKDEIKKVQACLPIGCSPY